MKWLFFSLALALAAILSTAPARSDQSNPAFLVPDGGHIEQRRNEVVIYDRNWNRQYTIQERPGGRQVILDKHFKPIGELQQSPAEKSRPAK